MTAGDSHTVTAKDGSTVPVPEEFICPLTLDVMSEPLLSREGHNYEREAIMNWVADHGTSPLTRETMRPSQLVRNRTLEARIRVFLQQHGIAKDESDNDDDVKKDGSKFLGYIPTTNMTLNSLAASSTASMSSQAVAAVAASMPIASATQEEHLAERRRQIADLIGSAMAELDDL